MCFFGSGRPDMTLTENKNGERERGSANSSLLRKANAVRNSQAKTRSRSTSRKKKEAN